MQNNARYLRQLQERGRFPTRAEGQIRWEHLNSGICVYIFPSGDFQSHEEDLVLGALNMQPLEAQEACILFQSIPDSLLYGKRCLYRPVALLLLSRFTKRIEHVTVASDTTERPHRFAFPLRSCHQMSQCCLVLDLRS